MRILALDLGKRMGVADGAETDFALNKRPRVEAVTLRGTSPEKRARWFGDWLFERLFDHELIITESPMNPAASKSADATIAQLYLHGALHGVAAVAGKNGIEVVHAPVMSVRRHFCWSGLSRSVCCGGGRE